MNVAKLLIAPETIQGHQLGTNLCNPVRDAFGNWVVSLYEATFLQLSDFEVITWIEPESDDQE